MKTMDYSFYVSTLRFMSHKVMDEGDGEGKDLVVMMRDLENAASCIEEQGKLVVDNTALRSVARALAGVAGILQKHILPETIAAENKEHEDRVRWMIDTSMAMVANLTVRAECLTDDDPSTTFTTELPPPPDASVN